MKVFRLLENNKVEYASFSGVYNRDIWLDKALVDTYDIAINDTITKVYPTYVELVNGRYIPDLVAIEADAQAKVKTEAKQAKLDALAVLTVITSNGHEFDADNTARQDMLSGIKSWDTIQKILDDLTTNSDRDIYIASSNLLDKLIINSEYLITHMYWKMANNKWVACTLLELDEASALAIQAKGAVLSL